MTEQDKIEVLKDFKEWTGGYEPAECDIAQIEEYVFVAADKRHDADELLELLSPIN